MKFLVAAASSAFVVAVFVAGCDSDGPHGHHRRVAEEACTVQPTCGACTPVLGCGWCFTSQGGVCVSYPDVCPRGSTGFTWDPPGCTPESDAGGDAALDARVTADASIGTGGGGDTLDAEAPVPVDAAGADLDAQADGASD